MSLSQSVVGPKHRCRRRRGSRRRRCGSRRRHGRWQRETKLRGRRERGANPGGGVIVVAVGAGPKRRRHHHRAEESRAEERREEPTSLPSPLTSSPPLPRRTPSRAPLHRLPTPPGGSLCAPPSGGNDREREEGKERVVGRIRWWRRR